MISACVTKAEKAEEQWREKRLGGKELRKHTLSMKIMEWLTPEGTI
jgi:hypothetical protein